jgi:RNA polymerase sigma-70 factor (ECF subfamily)
MSFRSPPGQHSWKSLTDARGAAMTQLDTPAEEFPALADRYRRELMAHCYRMTGSVYDAEDMVQETYVRAWRSFEGFEGRSSLRTWLYRIATNVCLTALEGKDRRPLPTGLGQPGSRAGDPLVEATEVSWLEPVPDVLVDADGTDGTDPAAVVANRDTIRLAFVAALQHLPARQRAVLILRDVLRWKAAEVAEALGTSVAAVNSALQRAHAQLADRAPSEATTTDDLDAAQRAMLDRYVQAFWDKDIDALVTMLAEDAVWEMPPFTSWYQGSANIGRLVGTQCPGNVHDMPMLATVANGQPAYGLYMRQPAGHFEPFHLQVLTLRGTEVTHVGAFFERRLFETFGLPASLPAEHLGGARGTTYAG